MKRGFWILCALVVLGWGFSSFSEENTDLESNFKFIVNVQNSNTSLSKKQVSDLFLKRVTVWPDRTQVVPIMHTSRSPFFGKFVQSILGMNKTEYQRYWQRKVFSGKAKMPVEGNSLKEISDFVRSHPGAIGYVSKSYSVSGVKELSVTP